MTESYSERDRKKNPLLYEKTRLVMDVANDLALALEDLGLTQRELADRLGKSPGIVSRQLGGSENLSLEKLAEIAFALGMRAHVQLEDIEGARREDSVLTYEFPRLVYAYGKRVDGEFRLKDPVPKNSPTKYVCAG